jgi:pimeloyl-ACP methyl ester carboxylesterase
MLFTAINPIMVAKLIVADIAPRFYPIHHHQILEGLSNLDFSIIDSRKKADIELSKYVDDFGVRQFLLKNLYWVSPGILGLRMNLKILFENVHEVGESLPSHLIINTETLFLRGDKSEYILEDDISNIADQFNNFSMKTIPNSGHWLHAENPNVFFSEILNFLS